MRVRPPLNAVDLGVSYSHNTVMELLILVYLRSEEMIDAKNSRVVVTPPIRAFPRAFCIALIASSLVLACTMTLASSESLMKFPSARTDDISI